MSIASLFHSLQQAAPATLPPAQRQASRQFSRSTAPPVARSKPASPPPTDRPHDGPDELLPVEWRSFAAGEWTALDADPLSMYGRDGGSFDEVLDAAGYERTAIDGENGGGVLSLYQAIHKTPLTAKYRFVIEINLSDGPGQWVAVADTPSLVRLLGELRGLDALASTRGRR